MLFLVMHFDNRLIKHLCYWLKMTDPSSYFTHANLSVSNYEKVDSVHVFISNTNGGPSGWTSLRQDTSDWIT